MFQSSAYRAGSSSLSALFIAETIATASLLLHPWCPMVFLVIFIKYVLEYELFHASYGAQEDKNSKFTNENKRRDRENSVFLHEIVFFTFLNTFFLMFFGV